MASPVKRISATGRGKIVHPSGAPHGEPRPTLTSVTTKRADGRCVVQRATSQRDRSLTSARKRDPTFGTGQEGTPQFPAIADVTPCRHDQPAFG
jgi:hypothetical protein